MPHLLAGLLALLQLAVPCLTRDALTERLRSGEWLRFHVIAHDDTDAMQSVKLCIRDAVQTCYVEHRPQDLSMLAAAQALLPALSQAASDAARREGFTGEIVTELAVLPFGERKLGDVTIPAGEYPALVIRLGDAQGRNWWGLLDPETSLIFAAVEDTQDGILLWDWSWQALWAALFGRPITADA